MQFTADTRSLFHRAFDHALISDPAAWPHPQVYAYEENDAVLFGVAGDRIDLPTDILCAIPADRVSLARMIGREPSQVSLGRIQADGHYGAVVMALAQAAPDEQHGALPATEESARRYAESIVYQLLRDSAGHYSIEAAEHEPWQRMDRPGEAGFSIEMGLLIVPNVHHPNGGSWTFSFRELAEGDKQTIADVLRVPATHGEARVYAKAKVRECLAQGYTSDMAMMEDGTMHRPRLAADYLIERGLVWVVDEKKAEPGVDWAFSFADLESELIAEGQGMGIAFEAACRLHRGVGSPAAQVEYNERRDAILAQAHHCPAHVQAVFQRRVEGDCELLATFVLTGREDMDELAASYVEGLRAQGSEVVVRGYEDLSLVEGTLSAADVESTRLPELPAIPAQPVAAGRGRGGR